MTQLTSTSSNVNYQKQNARQNVKLEDINFPYNYEAEKMLISQLMLDITSFYDIIDVGLTHKDFYVGEFSKRFNVIVGLLKENKDVNLVTVGQHLDIDDEVITYALTTGGIKDNAIIVKELAIKRGLIHQANKIYGKAFDKEVGLDILKKDINKMMEISYVEPEAKTFSEELDTIYEELYTDSSDRVLTNYKIVDTQISFKKKQLVTIAGRPGTGKSSIMGCFALAMENVALFSLEMSRQEIALRMASSISQLPFQELDQGLANRGEEFKSKVRSAFDVIKAKNISVYDNVTSLTSIVLEIKKLKMTKNIDAVFIDYLQLMGGVDSKISRALQIGTMTRTLKQLAKELDIFIMIGSQLNREILKRVNRTPQLSDLRESGDIEQDSDIVLFIDDDEDLPGRKELIIGKYRNGKRCKFAMKFSDNTMTLIDSYYEAEKEDGDSDDDSIR